MAFGVPYGSEGAWCHIRVLCMMMWVLCCFRKPVAHNGLRCEVAVNVRVVMAGSWCAKLEIHTSAECAYFCGVIVSGTVAKRGKNAIKRHFAVCLLDFFKKTGFYFRVLGRVGFQKIANFTSRT